MDLLDLLHLFFAAFLAHAGFLVAGFRAPGFGRGLRFRAFIWALHSMNLEVPAAMLPDGV